MAVRIGINGLGRIGRCVLRAITENNRRDVELVAVNGPAPIETHVHLLKYDSVHGAFPAIRQVNDATLNAGYNDIRLLRERDPKNVPWGDLGVDIVLECTGKFNSYEEAAAHLESGAKKVIISAPAKNVEATIVCGVNDQALKAEHKIVSIGSCTTNCLAPVAKVLQDAIGIRHGFMTTIHAYTGDQNLVDGSHKDLRRARAAALSIVPSSTGAAKAIGLVLPELAGKLDGTALRVPVPNVSMVDLKVVTERATSAEEINQLMRAASSGAMRGILGICDEPLVSADFNHTLETSIFDIHGTKVIDGTFVRVAAWYDNEWGFSNRMIDLAVKMR